MKPIPTAVVIFQLAAFAIADDAPTLLVDKALPLLAAPNFSNRLDDNFHIAKGTWTPDGGVLTVIDLPEEKHIPVLHHLVGLATARIEVEFFLNGPGTFLIGCDSDEHVGRVGVNAGGLAIAEDSVKPSHTIATLPLKVSSAEWHHLLVEWTGDKMAARLDGNELTASHPYLATKKARSWLAAGNLVKIRNLKISGE
jgi:hypothetical protein